MTTNQQLFDIVYKPLITQQHPCLDEYKDCVYRNEKGEKCAVGWLIPDDRYLPEFDQVEGDSTITNHIPLKVLLTELYGDIDFGFLRRLQICHDNVQYDNDLEAPLNRFAEEENLVIPK